MASSAVKPSPRVLANRQNGRRGGLATAQRYGKEFTQARAEKAGQAVLSRYGEGFYRFIAKSRKKTGGWPKGKPRKPITVNPADVILNPAQ